MRKWLMAFVATIVVCLGIAPSQADDIAGLSVSYTAQPVSMVVPEEILVRLTLVFEDTESIGNIRISREDGTIIANVDVNNITSGQPYVLSDTMIPTEKQLNNNMVVYTILYTEDYALPSASEKQETVVIPLEKLPAIPGIEFTRLAPYTLVSPGDEIGIVYTVFNTGNVAITNLYLSDALSGEVARVDRLEPGERMSFVQKAAITNNAVSIPRIVYSHAATSNSMSRELAPTAIIVAKEDLRMTLTADSYETVASGTVKLTCNVENKGNVSYGNIVVGDDGLGRVLFPVSEIKPGEKHTFTKTVSIKQDTTFKFTLGARCETGRQIQVDSNPVIIRLVTHAYDSMDINLEAEVVSMTGTSATVELRLQNNGSIGIRNVRLSERGRGIFKTLFIVPPGKTVVRRAFTVKDPDKLAFMAEATDSFGGVLTVLSNEVAVDGETPRLGVSEPDVVPPLLVKADSVSYKVPDVYYTYTNMILLASLVVIVLMAIAFIGVTRRRREMKRREDERAKTIRRNLMRAGRQQDNNGDIDSKEIKVAVYDNLRNDKKYHIKNERDRRPGSI